MKLHADDVCSDFIKGSIFRDAIYHKGVRHLSPGFESEIKI
jgi:hypothetical protein